MLKNTYSVKSWVGIYFNPREIIKMGRNKMWVLVKDGRDIKVGYGKKYATEITDGTFLVKTETVLTRNNRHKL